MYFFDSLISILAPYECLGCAKVGTILCSNCEQRLYKRNSTCWRCNKLSEAWRVCSTCRHLGGPRAVIAPILYENLAKDLVGFFKFKHARGVAKFMAGVMVSCVTDQYDCVTYVPTAAKRVRQRGYDQAELLAHSLASYLGLPCYKLLTRTGSSRQVGSTKTERQLQAATSYTCVKNLEGQNVLLVDDVISTGSTVNACSRLLRRQGAKHVDVAVFALRK